MPGLDLLVSDLYLSFAGQEVIALPQFQLPSGMLAVLAGPSGSGKSTLLYLLSGLLTPGRGQISWAGTDLAKLSGPSCDRWRRDNAGFIFQDFHLFPELSPLDNVLAPAWFSALSAAPKRPTAQNLLDRLGVPQRRDTALLSRGEQQRVAIARALLSDPAVIFADEPTASLDAASGTEVITILSGLARDQGRTIIAASHDPALIAAADIVLRLDHGHSSVALQEHAA